MNYKIKTISVFERNLKKLAKKYPSIKEDFAVFLESLSLNPKQGIPLGNNSYKTRMKITSTSKGKGKSSGARLITHIVVSQETVYLLTIFDKSEQENISDNQIKALIKLIKE